MLKGTAMPELGRCSQGPAVSSRCRCRCRAAAGLWCHLVGCRLPAAPLCRGERVTPARVSPGAAGGSGLRARRSGAGERCTPLCNPSLANPPAISLFCCLAESLSFPCWEELVPSGNVSRSSSCHRECFQTLPQGELGVYLHHHADEQISRSPCVPINIREQKYEQVMQHMAKSFILSL